MYERLRAWVRPLGAGENLPLVALLLVLLERGGLARAEHREDLQHPQQLLPQGQWRICCAFKYWSVMSYCTSTGTVASYRQDSYHVVE